MKMLIGTVLLLIASAPSVGADAPPGANAVPRHLELARELVATVRPENNNYEISGPGRGVRWKTDFPSSENSVNASCSVFVTAILDRAASTVPGTIAAHTGWKRELRVSHYFEAMQQGLGLQPILSLADAEPGDFFLFKCTDFCVNSKSSKIQGHIAFIDAKPVPIDPRPPVIESTVQWLVTVIDSTDRPHDRNDTRWRAAGETRVSGVGRGSYRLYTDANGVPVGYTSGVKHPKFHPVSIRPVAIARPQP